MPTVRCIRKRQQLLTASLSLLLPLTRALRAARNRPKKRRSGGTTTTTMTMTACNIFSRFAAIWLAAPSASFLVGFAFLILVHKV